MDKNAFIQQEVVHWAHDYVYKKSQEKYEQIKM